MRKARATLPGRLWVKRNESKTGGMKGDGLSSSSWTYCIICVGLQRTTMFIDLAVRIRVHVWMYGCTFYYVLGIWRVRNFAKRRLWVSSGNSGNIELRPFVGCLLVLWQEIDWCICTIGAASWLAGVTTRELHARLYIISHLDKLLSYLPDSSNMPKTEHKRTRYEFGRITTLHLGP